MAKTTVEIDSPETITKTKEIVARQTGAMTLEEAFNNYLRGLIANDYNYLREQSVQAAAEKARKDFPIPDFLKQPANPQPPNPLPPNPMGSKKKKKKK